MRSFRHTLVLLIVFLVGRGSQCCRGQPNDNKIIDADFQLVGGHEFGQKFVFEMSATGQTFYLLKLHGTAYQAGFAYGTLMRRELQKLVHDLWAYYYSVAEEEFKFITKLPERLQPAGRAFAIQLYKGLLTANYVVTRKYTPKRFMDELAGLAAGSGLTINELIQLNMIPEYTRAGCSILGAWGKATADGAMIHLRALDWDVNNPMNQFPTIALYDFVEKGSHPFINVGWPGFVGSLTGFGEFVGIGEKVRKQNPVKQNETRLGKPWTYALRDLLQFSKTIGEGLSGLNKTKRTCSIYAGVSSAQSNTFRLIEYSFKEFKVYDDNNFPYTATHLQMDNVVFMPIHDDSDSCFNDLLHKQYGKITDEWIMNTLAPMHKTGDTQLAVFNFKTQQLLLQVSLDKKLSFDRPALRINLKGMFQSRYT